MRLGGVVAALVVAGIFAAVYFGWLGGGNSPSSPSAAPAATANVEIPYYANISAWPRYVDEQTDFSIAHPLDFVTDSTRDGDIYFTLAIPATFLPQTNFSEAILTVSVGKRECPAKTKGAVQKINGILFSVSSHLEEEGADIYLQTSYSSSTDRGCVTLEYVIHAARLETFPPEFGLKPFDEKKIRGVLDRIVGTFRLV